jgi:hypothetical protein
MRALIILVLFSAGWLPVFAFDIRTVPEEIAEVGVVNRTQATDGKTRFSFIAAPTWVSSADHAGRRLSLQSPSPQVTINVQLSTNAMPANAAKLKEMVNQKFKNVTVVDEFQAASGSGPGLGIDFRHTVANYQLTTRFLVFKSPEGIAEVSLAGPGPEFDKFRNQWIGFINSFRVEATPLK